MTTKWNPRMPDVERFTEGDCHYFARAINKLTGWPIHAFYDAHEKTGNIHAFVVMPDGRVVDIEGVWDPQEFKSRWEPWTLEGQSTGVVHVPDWRRMRREWGSPEFGLYTYRRARQMAQRLLDHFGLDHARSKP